MVMTVIDTKTREIKLPLSRQDYNAIAKIANVAYLKIPKGDTYQADYQEGVSELVLRLADYFELANERFIKEKFIKAAIPGERIGD